MRPLGFSLLDKFVKRAGMDYWDKVNLSVVDSLDEVLSGVDEDKIFCLSTKGAQYYGDEALSMDGVYVFGSESKGLPEEVLKILQPHVLPAYATWNQVFKFGNHRGCSTL